MSPSCAFCVCLACFIAVPEQQEVIDTSGHGGYELRRRRRSLDDPQFGPASADEVRAAAQERPSVAQLRQVVRNAGLVGGWSVDDEDGRMEWEGSRKGKREETGEDKASEAGADKEGAESDEESEGKDKDVERWGKSGKRKKQGRMWAIGQLLQGLIFGDSLQKTQHGPAAQWVSRNGLFVFLPVMVVLTAIHLILWYIWFAKRQSMKIKPEKKEDKEIAKKLVNKTPIRGLLK